MCTITEGAPPLLPFIADGLQVEISKAPNRNATICSVVAVLRVSDALKGLVDEPSRDFLVTFGTMYGRAMLMLDRLTYPLAFWVGSMFVWAAP
jgi:hypothetical protein